MARSLHRRGVLTKLRHSAGQDVEGGCGQLRARALGVAVGFPPAGFPDPEGFASPIALLNVGQQGRETRNP